MCLVHVYAVLKMSDSFCLVLFMRPSKLMKLKKYPCVNL